MKKFRPEILLLFFALGIFYLIPAVVTLCGGRAEEKAYMIFAVLLPEAAAGIAYVTLRRRYLFPILAMSLLPVGYGVFLYPWHAEVWYSYYPDMGMCLLAGVMMAFFHVFIVLAYVLIGVLIGGIAAWEKERRSRRNNRTSETFKQK